MHFNKRTTQGESNTLHIYLSYIHLVRFSGMATFTNLVPTIDFSGDLEGDEAKKHQVAMEIGNACESIGFFVIKGHGIDPEIIRNAWKSTWDCKCLLVLMSSIK